MTAALAIHSRPMVTPEQLRQFKQDFELLRSASAAALLYLKFEDEKDRSEKGMKRTWRAAVDAGEALKRMHESENYRDQYASWASLCRALKIGRQHSYRLIACAKTVEQLPPSARAKLATTPLSLRQVETLAEADSEQQEDVLDEAAETGDTPAAFAKLRAMLKSAPTPEKMAEAEAPKRAAGDLTWIKRNLLSLRKWFDGQGLAEAVKHLDEMLLLVEARSASAA